MAPSLVGTWKLLSREDRTAGGERRIDPVMGADPIAYLSQSLEKGINRGGGRFVGEKQLRAGK